jgi:protein-tyrosine-phosphatase
VAGVFIGVVLAVVYRRLKKMIGRVLCICSGNYCRSQILAALLKREAQRYGYQLLIRTAGISDWGVGRNPAPTVERIVTEIAGGFVEPFSPHCVTQEEAAWADVILVMDDEQRNYFAQFDGLPGIVAKASWLIDEDFDIPNPHHEDEQQLVNVTHILTKIVEDGYSSLHQWLRLCHLGKLVLPVPLGDER